MRKIVFIVLFLAAFSNGFAEQFNLKSGNTIQNNAILIDFFPMLPGANGLEFGEGIGLGIMYERKVHQYISAVGAGSFTTDFEDIFSYSFSPHLRVYPFGTTVGKLFSDVGVVYSGSLEENNDIHTLSAIFSAGWNFILWKGLVLEPGIFFRRKIVDIYGVKPYNFGFGFIMGIGWAFNNINLKL